MKRFKLRPMIAWLRNALVFMAIAMAAWGASAEEVPEQIVIGYQMIPTPETVVKDMGWHEETLGAPVKWMPFDSGKHVNQAMASGSIDIGLVGTSPCAVGISQGIPMEAIWIHDIIGDNEALAVKQDRGIDKLRDLIGKTIAVPFGSTTHYHLMVALKLDNIDPANLNIVDLEPRQMPEAWNLGRIDAGFVWEPTLSKLFQNDGKRILSSRDLAERGFPTADLCVVRTDFATKYPSLVVKYLKNLDRAVRYYRSDPQKAALAVSRQLNITPEEAERQMKGLIFLTGQEQLSGKYVGDMNLSFGLYTLLKDTADFLERSGQIASSPSWPVFMRSVSASYVQKIIVKKKATFGGPRPKKQ